MLRLSDRPSLEHTEHFGFLIDGLFLSAFQFQNLRLLISLEDLEQSGSLCLSFPLVLAYSPLQFLILFEVFISPAADPRHGLPAALFADSVLLLLRFTGSKHLIETGSLDLLASNF